MTRNIQLAAAALTLALGGAAHAAPFVVTYDFADPNRAAPTTISGAASGTDWTAGLDNSSTSFPSNGEYRDNGDGISVTAAAGPGNNPTDAEIEAAAVAGGDYAEFTLAATNPGELLDFAQLHISARDGSSSNYRQAFIRTSQDNYTDTIAVKPDTNSNTFADYDFDISGLADAASTTFRLYVYVVAFNTTNGTATGQTGGSIIFDQVQVSGATAIPEPASLSLLALGGAAMLRRRRA